MKNQTTGKLTRTDIPQAKAEDERLLQLRLWKKALRLHRRLKQLKYKPPFKFIKMNSWRSANSPLSSFAMPNQWFEELELYSIEHVNTG